MGYKGGIHGHVGLTHFEDLPINSALVMVHI